MSTVTTTPRPNTHRLPEWMTWLQENVLLSFLVVTEGYLLGALFVMGWVANIEDPSSWGWFHAIGVALFFGSGVTCGGIALRSSVTMAQCFGERRPLLGLANLVGLVVFSTADIWASLVERAAHLQPGPADTTVLNLLGASVTAIGPTNLVISILLPFGIFFAGLSQPTEDPEAEARHEREHRLHMQKLRHDAEAMEVRAKGLKAGWNTLTAKVDEVQGGDSDPDNNGPQGGNTGSLPSGEDGALAQGKERSRLRSLPQPEPLKGRITATALVDWLSESLGVECSLADALAFIKSMPGSGPTKGIHGQPLSAPKSSTLQKARARWGAHPESAASAS